MSKLLFVIILTTLFFQNILISQTLDTTFLEINFGAGSEPRRFTNAGDKMYFVADDGEHGYELWVTDGSYISTKMVKDIAPGNAHGVGFSEDSYTTIGNIFYFIAQEHWTTGKELWRTDGTEAGTYKIIDENVVNNADMVYMQMAALNDKIIYNFDSQEFGNELWISDGTNNGTHLLKDIRPGSMSGNPSTMFLFNNQVYFMADDGINGYELWKTDGTESGTQMLLNLNGTYSGVRTANFLVLNDKFYFAATDVNSGKELWSSDGTAAGTQLVKDILPGNSSSLMDLTGSVVGDIILFKARDGVHGDELWRTDGTAAGTYLVKDINVGATGSLYNLNSFITFGNDVYFFADNGINGREVWKSDGTEAGTILLKDIGPGSNSGGPNNLHATSEYLYFTYYDFDDFEEYLWISDGTEVGTRELLREDVSNLTLMEFNNKTFFTAYTQLKGNELWETDGDPDNTNIFKNINGYFDAEVKAPRFINDKLFFYARNKVVGREPYISDGTISGTKLIADINPGDSNTDSNNSNYNSMDFAQAGNRVVFFAKNNSTGYELYSCDLDGNDASILKDINETTASSIGSWAFLINFNNEAYFPADDGINGTELWKTNGTESGTVMVKDITTNSGTALNNPFIFKNYLYFQSQNSLWRTDGTEAGTQFVTYMYNLNILTTSDDYIFFTTPSNYPDNANTNQIWRIDENNNEELIEEFPTIENIKLGAIYNNELYFAASDFPTGYHAIYKTSGTPNTAEQVFYGTNYNIFLDMEVCGDYLYITRGPSDGNHFIREIWKTDGTTQGSQIIISETTHPIFTAAPSFTCLQNSKFLFNDYNSSGIYSISGDEDNARFHPFNVLNENFQIRTVSEIYSNGNQIMHYSYAPAHGAELYSSEASAILGNSDFQSSLYQDQQSVFRIYPNPTNNYVTIENILKYPIERLEIYNITGQKLKEAKVENSNLKVSISLESLSLGIYLIKIYSNGNTETLKVIKE